MGRLGLEPRTNGLKVRCAANCASDPWWTRSDLNRGPTGYEPGVLTTELQVQTKKSFIFVRHLIVVFCFCQGLSFFIKVICL